MVYISNGDPIVSNKQKIETCTGPNCRTHTAQCFVCEVWYGQVPIILIMHNTASPVIAISDIERYDFSVNQFLCIQITYNLIYLFP